MLSAKEKGDLIFASILLLALGVGIIVVAIRTFLSGKIGQDLPVAEIEEEIAK